MPLRKVQPAYLINPKDWYCTRPRIAHITTHTYRGKPFFEINETADYVKEQMYFAAKEWNIELVEVGFDFTHSHFALKQRPGQNLRTMVGKLKGITSRKVRQKFQCLKDFPRFWARSFYVVFYEESQVNIPIRYIRSQLREEGARKGVI